MEWIPVSQALPAPYVDVLLAFDDHDSAVLGYQIDGRWFVLSYNGYFRCPAFLSVDPTDAPVYWAPIQPKLPNGTVLCSVEGALHTSRT